MAAKLQQPSSTNTTHDSVATNRKVQPGSSESGSSVRLQLEEVVEALVGVAEDRDIVATAMEVMRLTTDQQDVDKATSARNAKRRNPEFRK